MNAPVTVRTPATTANLGPGYDSFGLALALFNTFTAELADEWSVEVHGVDAQHLKADESNPVARAMQHAFEACGRPELRAHLICENQVPVGRGLGSSSAAVVGGIKLGLLLAQGRADDRQVLDLATELEGHPDNVAAAVYGGFVIATSDHDGTRAFEVPVAAGLAAVVAVSRLPFKTKRARRLLPETVPHADAAFNAARAGMLASGVALGRRDLIAAGLHDRIHQQYRAAAISGFDEVVSALVAAGVEGAVLSGAGPTVIGLVARDSDAAALTAAEAIASSSASAVVDIGSYRAPFAVAVCRPEQC